MRIKLTALTILIAITPMSANAYDWSTEAYVSWVDASSAPNFIAFAVNGTGGSCQAGATLSWDARGQDNDKRISNSQSIMAVLLTALASGKKVRLFGNNGSCIIQYLHIVN